MDVQAASQTSKDRRESSISADSDEGPEVEDEGENLVCPCVKCGRVFTEPVRVTNLSSASDIETYYACPYCFSKLDIDEAAKDTKHFDEKSHERTKKDVGVRLEESTSVPKCNHHVGYLKNRPSNSAIPDECLACPKILQCMV